MPVIARCLLAGLLGSVCLFGPAPVLAEQVRTQATILGGDQVIKTRRFSVLVKDGWTVSACDERDAVSMLVVLPPGDQAEGRPPENIVLYAFDRPQTVEQTKFLVELLVRAQIKGATPQDVVPTTIAGHSGYRAMGIGGGDNGQPVVGLFIALAGTQHHFVAVARGRQERVKDLSRLFMELVETVEYDRTEPSPISSQAP